MDPVESYLPTWAFRHSRHHLQWVHLCHCVPRCLARRLTFRSIWRIRRRTIGWISQVIVLLSQKVPLRSTFQRSRGIIEKGWHLFSGTLCGSSWCCPLLTKGHPTARSKLHSWSVWSQVADATVETL